MKHGLHFILLLIIASSLSVGCEQEYKLYDARCGMPCYTGAPETRGVGSCSDGIAYCEDHQYIACEEEVLPSDEYCDGLDNNCDGEVDNFVLDESRGDSCGSSIGSCIYGSIECVLGEMTCVGGLGPHEEVCDGLDNDCNGIIDDTEHLGYCYEGDTDDLLYGECHAGVLFCDMGEEVCLNQQLPEEEVCDGLDNDCDGFVDEDLEDGDKIDIVFMIDLSGSMATYYSDVANASQLFANAFSGNSDFRFALVGVPYPAGSEPGVILDFSDASTFQLELATLSTLSTGSEPSWDAAYEVCSELLPLGWTEGARRYAVLFTDEEGQSYDGLSEADATNACASYGVTFYGFTKFSYVSYFDDIASATGGEIYLLDSAGQMEDDLSEIFSDQCW